MQIKEYAVLKNYVTKGCHLLLRGDKVYIADPVQDNQRRVFNSKRVLVGFEELDMTHFEEAKYTIQETLRPTVAPEPAPERFAVLEDSISGHCCFEYSVIDNTIPEQVTEEDGSKTTRMPICECFERKDADLIATALNNLCNSLRISN